MFYQTMIVDVLFCDVLWVQYNKEGLGMLDILIRWAGSAVNMKLETLVTVAQKRTLNNGLTIHCILPTETREACS